MSVFIPSQIDDLKPLARRYDVAIEDDFVVSVLPNGIKTWVFLSVQDGRVQRRTLGVHPDMSFDAARLSLAAARETRRSLHDAMERGVRAAAARAADAGRSPASTARVKRSVLLASSLAAGVVVAAAAWLGLRVAGGPPESAALAEIPAAAREFRPAHTAAPPAGADAAAMSAAESDASAAQVTPPDPVELAAPSPPASSAPESAQSSEEVREPAAAEPGRADTPMASTADATTTLADEGPPGVVIHDARVVRAVLTDEVVKREPVGALGPEIEGEPGGVAQLYFFTELRRLGGQQLRYRWVHEGRVEAEKTMNVGPTWRWRNYSRKDILPSQTGRWHVQLLDDAGAVLAEARFAYRNDASGTQSADAN